VGDELSKWMLGASPELGLIRSSRNETGKILCSYTTRPSPSDSRLSGGNSASVPHKVSSGAIALYKGCWGIVDRSGKLVDVKPATF